MYLTLPYCKADELKSAREKNHQYELVQEKSLSEQVTKITFKLFIHFVS